MKGLAWGRGINPPQDGPQKVEGDHKNPMGLFKIGPVYGYAPKLPEGAKAWPYHQVTDREPSGDERAHRLRSDRHPPRCRRRSRFATLCGP